MVIECEQEHAGGLGGIAEPHGRTPAVGADLEAILAERSIGRLVVTGAQTDACIRSTLHGALVRGYDATLVEDAHTTEDLRQWGAPLAPDEAIAYTNMYWQWSKAPGRTGDTVPTAEVDFAAG
jgi:hypothetical protein